MTQRRKVDDAMVERFSRYVAEHEGCEWKDALNAAINPEPEPEIVVTEEMTHAGFKYWYTPNSDPLESRIRGIYRAMRRLEPTPVTAKVTFPQGTPHRRSDDLNIGRYHRRKDDK